MSIWENLEFITSDVIKGLCYKGKFHSLRFILEPMPLYIPLTAASEVFDIA